MRSLIHAWTLLVALCSGAILAPSAGAQIPTAPDSYLVVVRDGVQLRCRAGTIWYVVRELDEGQVLRVTGESDGWLAVEYPPGTPAVARIERVELRENGSGERFAVLSRASTLYAFNDQANTRDDSYVQIFADEPIGAGTRLPLVDTIERRGGGIGGYLVTPPRGAIGFVQPLGEDVRTATQAEIDAFLASSGWGADEDGETTAEDEPLNDVVDDAPAPADEDVDEDTTPPATLDEDEDERTGTTSDTTTIDETTQVDAAGDDPYRKAERELNSLDDALRRVLASPVMDAELAGLIDSYEGLRFSLPDDPASAAFRDAIAVRLELLDLRDQLQRLSREASDLETRVRTTPGTDVVARSASLGYEAVGRLMPSLIYDGKRLPLLYRIVSVDTAYGRTIAYVAPAEGVDLVGSLGAIVGVRGAATTEQDRRVPVLAPEGLDVLRRAE